MQVSSPESGEVAAAVRKYRASSLEPQMMRWTPPGDLNGIEVPKSSRSLIKTTTGGIHREAYDYRYRPGKICL
jgi:hypothetical protein